MPREVHETYEVDPADPENREKQRLVGYTVITRESAWDEESRARAVALTEYDESLCSCGCGLPRQVAHKRQVFNVDSFVCYAGRAIAVKEDLDRKDHKPESGYFRGRHYYAFPAETHDD